MSIRYFFHRFSRFNSLTARHLIATAASCVVAGSSMTACAAMPLYNPDNLGAEHFSRVSDICENVMGLSPKEPLSGGTWLGEPRLDYYTSHYRACVVTLSDSLQSVADAQLTKQADVDCRAKGFASGSSDLALCVLQSVSSRPNPVRVSQSDAAPSLGGNLPAARGSFFYASPHEAVRRVQVACAALGLEPSEGAFESCVSKMDHALYAIDNPVI